jgi:hypothetical protein
MPSNYQQIPDADEKLEDIPVPRLSSRSTRGSISICYDAPLFFEEKSPFSKRIWLMHTLLLSLSFTMFALSYFRPLSTLESVRRFSSYCKYIIQHLMTIMLTRRPIATAATAVEYERIMFNNTMGIGSPYVGKGPEVDKAWRALSYDSKCDQYFNRSSPLTKNSWRSNDNSRRIEDARYARELSKSKTPKDWR